MLQTRQEGEPAGLSTLPLLKLARPAAFDHLQGLPPSSWVPMESPAHPRHAPTLHLLAGGQRQARLPEHRGRVWLRPQQRQVGELQSCQAVGLGRLSAMHDLRWLQLQAHEQVHQVVGPQNLLQTGMYRQVVQLPPLDCPLALTVQWMRTTAVSRTGHSILQPANPKRMTLITRR